MPDHHLAQINVARLRAPIDDPIVAEFVEALDHINALAERSPGFIWRLQTEAGNATGIKAYDDELVILNMSLWASPNDLFEYVYQSGHVDFLRNRRDWFERHGEAHMCMWWVPAGETPTVAQGVERLDELRANGATPRAFTFRDRFEPEAVER